MRDDTSAVLSVDLGGTRMRAAIVAPDGELRDRRSEPTPQGATCPDALLDLVGDVLDSDAAARAVIGVPGRVDYARGRLEHAPNLPPRWPEALDERQLEAKLGVPVALANDADLAAVGETWFGAGRGHDDVVYLTVSTGIGAGVVLGRRLVAGARSLAEAGHTVIDLTALAAGEPATFEDLGSGTALEHRAEDAGLPGDGERIVELVHEGDPEAERVWGDLVDAVAAGVTNLAFPTVIVLGGGVSTNDDLLLPPLRDHLAQHGPPDLPVRTEVRVAELGDDAGLVGAAAWRHARRTHRSSNTPRRPQDG